jgi:DNA-binding MarR family transcriptional regulator
LLDPVIHQPIRLQVLAALQRNRELSFVALRDMLDTTNGNLHAHGQVLEKAGYIAIRRALGRSGFEVRYRLLDKGALALQEYAKALQGLLEGGPRTPKDTAGAADPAGHPGAVDAADYAASARQKTG